MSSSNFIPLVSQTTVKKYQKKAARLESLLKSEPRARHPEVAQRVEILRNFFADVEKKANVRRTRETLVAFKEEEKTMAQHEDAFINYVVIRAPQKAMIEKQSSAYL